jgi:hypothetical protein
MERRQNRQVCLSCSLPTTSHTLAINNSPHGIVIPTCVLHTALDRASHNPAIALSTDEHSATKKAYRDWLEEKTGKRVGGVIDWSKIFKAEIKKLSERMFDDAKVPKAARKNYYAVFNKYLKKGCKP